MGLSQEIKEFTGGFQAGWKMATPTEAQERRREKAEDNANIDAEAAKLGGKGIVTAPHTYSSGDGSTTVSGIRTGGNTSVGNNVSEANRSFARAIAHNESDGSGGYNALGRVLTKKDGSTDQAIGAYQVMRSNIPSWTEKHLGRRMTAEEFLKDPVAQDKVFDGEFGGYVKQYGNARDAASMWLTGKPLAQGAGRADANGTTGQAYTDKFSRTLASYAEGGRVMSDDEFIRLARAGAMESQNAPTVEPGGWTDPTIAAPEAVQAQQEVPLPPRRPGALELGPRPQAQYSALPSQGQTSIARRAINTAPREERQEAAPAQQEQYDPKSVNVFAGVHEAIDAGLKAIQSAFGFGDEQPRNIRTYDDTPQRVAQLHRNEGAATPEEVRQVDNTIDPNRQLSDDARAVARMYAGYSYFAQRGEYEKAQNYSKSMLLYIRGHMQMAGAVAEDQIKAGNIKGAARAIQEAHNQVPDGSTMYVDKVGPDGKVDYRMMDDNGDLTERGSANVNQLMQLAIGMKNGSEWFTQMTNARAGSLTAAQKLAEQRRQKDESALGQFNAGDDSDFMKSLSPERKEAFNKMSPAVQDHLKREFHRQQSEKTAADRNEKRDALNERRQERADQRMERADRKEIASDEKAQKETQDSQEWAAHTDAIRDAQDALNEQLAEDPEDEAKVKPLREAVRKATGAASDWMKGDGGRTKYGKELRDMTKPQRGSGAAATTGGAGSSSRGGGTASERQKQALEQQYVSMERKVRREGNTEEGQAQLRAMRSEVEFNKRDKGYDAEMKTEVDGVMPGIFGVDDVTKIPKEKKQDVFDYTDAVTGILRGDNGIPAEQAAAIAKEAVTSGKITRQDDGRYSVNGSRPVFISPEGIRAIAAIAQRNRPAAKPTTTVGNPFNDGGSDLSPAAQEDARDNAERQASREGAARDRQQRRKTAEYAQLQKDLGSDFRDGMTMAQMRRARLDRIRRNRRLNPEPDYNFP